MRPTPCITPSQHLAFHAAMIGSLIAACGVLQSQAIQYRAHGAWGLDEVSDSATKTEMCTDDLRFKHDCSTTPWRPLHGKTKQICVEGKQLPKLYVLGAQKTSTSSFARDLSCAGVQPMPSEDGSNWKEMHFFDSRDTWRGRDEEYMEWLKRMPDCAPAEDDEELGSSSSVLADFSPDNLRMVPGERPYNNVFVHFPSMLKSFYGNAVSDLTFVVMIREPLSRMHSAWYAASSCNSFQAICTDDCRADSVQDALKTALDNANQEIPVYTEWLWTSMYARHLKSWFWYFDPKQFYVIPYLEYGSGNADGICKDLAGRLDFAIDCESNGTPVSHAWQSTHPPVLEDFPLDSQLSLEFSAMMDRENEALWEILAKAHVDGMGLANYNGTTGSVEEIRDWVKQRW